MSGSCLQSEGISDAQGRRAVARARGGHAKGSRSHLLGGIALLLIGLAVVGSDARAACHKALVVVDVQKLYLSRATWLTSDGKGLVAKIEPLLLAARENGIPVIYVQHVNNPGISPDSSLVGFADAIAPKDGELVVQKLFPSGFQGTTLQAELEARGITDLIVTGLSSVGCVDATIKAALSLGFSVTVIADAHAAADSVPVTSGQNDVWKALGATIVWSNAIDFATLCPKRS